jgi:hypothetical protein
MVMPLFARWQHLSRGFSWNFGGPCWRPQHINPTAVKGLTQIDIIKAHIMSKCLPPEPTNQKGLQFIVHLF